MTDTTASPEEVDAVLAAEACRRTALLDVDLDALDALFADDLVHIHSTGLRHTKAELLAHIERKRGFVDITRGPLDVRVYGDLAIVVGPITNLMRQPDGSTGELVGIVTQVLRRESTGWRFISFQLTPDR